MKEMVWITVVIVSGLAAVFLFFMPRFDRQDLAGHADSNQVAEQGDKEHVSTPKKDVYAIVNRYVFPADTSSALEQTLRVSSQSETHTFKRHGEFLVVYADVQDENHPYGIRSISGGNGPNFVFRLHGEEASLAYRTNSCAVENRIQLIEIDDSLLLYSYGHAGLTSGPSEGIRYRWDGVEFVYADEK